ncbi:MAG: ribosomal protein S18 acetylase RimI-like enzyme [Ancylomarina sp.]|jgi:ribosomal protein S18 acetylase RimI-like enzyme
MTIQILEVLNQSHRKIFVDFPYKLYKGNEFWVPPLKSGELELLMEDKNPAFDFCKAKFWMAYQNGKVVGRIGAIVNTLAIEKQGEKIGRITRVEFIDQYEVSEMLFSVAEKWLKEEGMIGVSGPLGFSNLDHSGVLIEGHEWLPSMASDYHFAYYQNHFQRLAYQKEIDWLEFRITLPETPPDKAKRVAQLVKRKYGLKSLNFTTKKELEPYKEKIFKVFNDAFADLFGTFKLPEKLIRFYIGKYFPILNPRYVKIILDKEDQLVGFIIALPSLSKALQKGKGKLFPFGWWHLKKALKHPTEMDLMLTGVDYECQNRGYVSILMSELLETSNSDGLRFAETTGMLENNHVAIQLWKSFDHVQHKRKRCYRKMF